MDDNLSWLRDDLKALREGQGTMHAAVAGIGAKLDAHAEQLKCHEEEIKALTASHNELKGMAKGIKWLWGVIVAIMAAFGFHIASGK